MALHRNLDTRQPPEFRGVFEQAIDTILETVGPKAFRPISTLNAAVFDSVMVATAKRLAKGKLLKPVSFAEQYAALLADKEYQESVTRSTADEERVSTRMSLAEKYLSKAQ